jgi:hypothetical protein
MYLFDPDRGRGRRALIRDKAEDAANKAGEFADKVSRDLRDRASEVVAEAKGIFKGADSQLDLNAAEDEAQSFQSTPAFAAEPATPGSPYPSVGEPHVL